MPAPEPAPETAALETTAPEAAAFGTAEQAAATGWRLGERYLILERIGAGGMAEVFRARDELLARDVAIKVFHSQLDPADSAGGAQRQEVELHVLAQLSHPNLITLFDGRIAEATGAREHAYLVMELINGPSLAARLVDGPLAEPEVRRLAAQICDALSYVHGKGMVHRDVKPANILLGTDGTDPGDQPGAEVRARLSDFGIVRLLDSAHLTSANFMVGTASYLSPEQARGAEVGPAADIYSLGLVLLEALTGERSFPGPAMEAVMAKLAGPPTIPAGLPEPWPGLLTAMTTTDPARRPSAAQVADTLRGAGGAAALANPFAENTTVLASVPAAGVTGLDETSALPLIGDRRPLVDTVAPVERRGGGLGWLLAVLVLIAIVAVALYLVLHNRSSDSPSTPAPKTPAISVSAPATASKPASSAPATTTAPSTTAQSTAAPTTTAPSTSAPATSTPPSSASSAPPTSAPVTSASAGSTAPAQGGSTDASNPSTSPTLSPSGTTSSG